MHWIVQNNLFNEESHGKFISMLDKTNTSYDLVKVIPFSNQVEPDIVNDNKHTIVYGSTALNNISKDKGLYPGTFLNENHDVTVWSKYYEKYLLNTDYVIDKFSEVRNLWNGADFFIRPCGDDKLFGGHVLSWEEFKEWQNKVIDLKEGYTTLNADTLVAYSSYKHIKAEYRFFIIDGKIISASQYKKDGRIYYKNIDNDEALSGLFIFYFVSYVISTWLPSRGFVIDVAQDNDNNLSIIEVNCLNSSGFYDINTEKLILSINRMEY